jgi:hypothetical protein
MPTTAEIMYREFYDVPRMFVVRYRGKQYLFDGTFDESAEEYPDTYHVYVLPNLAHHELNGSWVGLSDKAEEHLGEVLVSNVLFDDSRRRAIDPHVIEEVTRASI